MIRIISSSFYISQAGMIVAYAYGSACKIGSVSLLMRFSGGMALISQSDQRYRPGFPTIFIVLSGFVVDILDVHKDTTDSGRSQF